jgi:hypothetical protein
MFAPGAGCCTTLRAWTATGCFVSKEFFLLCAVRGADCPVPFRFLSTLVDALAVWPPVDFEINDASILDSGFFLVGFAVITAAI